MVIITTIANPIIIPTARLFMMSPPYLNELAHWASVAPILLIQSQQRQNTRTITLPIGAFVRGEFD